MKTLSDKLCELCGVEPYYYYVKYNGDNEDFATFEEAKEFADKHNKKVQVSYPDFELEECEAAENFFKLFSLRVEDRMTVTDYIMHDMEACMSIHNADDYLRQLVRLIEAPLYLPVETERLKQAIKQAFS